MFARHSAGYSLLMTKAHRPRRWPWSVIRCDSVTSIIQSDVLGRSLLVDDTPARIVGVMPARFEFPDAQTQFWLPSPLDA